MEAGLFTIITIFGIPVNGIGKGMLKASMNWANRKSIKYRLIYVNERTNFKKNMFKYLRYVGEESVAFICFLLCWIIVELLVVMYSMNANIAFGGALVFFLIICIINKMCANRFLAFVLYTILGCLGILYVTELYIRKPEIIKNVAGGLAIILMIMIYYIIYHLRVKVKGDTIYYASMFITMRCILLVCFIAGFFMRQEFYSSLYFAWAILLLAEELGHNWIYQQELDEILIYTKNGHKLKAVKNVLQYENDKIGFIDYQGKEEVLENKVIDYIYYQQISFWNREKKADKVVCFVERKKEPFLGDKYNLKKDWLRLERIDNKRVTTYFIPISMVKKIYRVCNEDISKTMSKC